MAPTVPDTLPFLGWYAQRVYTFLAVPSGREAYQGGEGGPPVGGLSYAAATGIRSGGGG